MARAATREPAGAGSGAEEPARAADRPAPRRRRALIAARVLGGVVVLGGVFALGLLLAPSGRSGLILATDREANLWALIPSGWEDEDLVAPYGSELARWVDPNDTNESETVLARAPAGGAPRARAHARAARLRSRSGYAQSYLGPLTFAGGRVVWLLQYELAGEYTARFEFDACARPKLAVTVTLDAPSQSALLSEENSLPEGAEPVCDGPAFTSPDRADLAIPLHLPSS
jgi:hypothetical protein